MRNIIIDNIFSLMKKNKSIFFLTADMGINLVEKFEEKFPKRFLNVGIAEQNLVGIASGLSNCGFTPFIYTISNFLVHRCFEQIRNDVSLHKKNIVLLGTSCGFDNSPLGPTHHMVDDWGHIKSLPNFEIYCPSSNKYSSILVNKLLKSKNPKFVRVPKGSYDEIETSSDSLYINNKSKNIVVTYGNMVKEYSEIIKNHKISFLVLNKIHPLINKYKKILSKYNKIYVAEDHFAETGMYSSICQLMSKERRNIKIESLAPKNYNLKVGQTSEYFYKFYNLDKKSLLKKVL